MQNEHPEYCYPSDEQVFDLVREELERARHKFPTNENQLATLHEESGELAKALLEHTYGNAEPEEIIREAVQVASMAVRVATEGDSSFDYDQNHK